MGVWVTNVMGVSDHSKTFVIHCKYNEEPQLGEYKRSHWPCGEWIAKGKAGAPIRRRP